MAFISKRGKYYYANWHTTEKGKEIYSRKSLRTRHKDVAQQMLRELEKLEVLGRIDPFSPNFDPVREIRKREKPKHVRCKTVREAADRFLATKEHKSKATKEAYQWAIDHFIDFNNLEKADPLEIEAIHFEKIIFKPGIKSNTRHYYFRHFRAWWNWMLRKKIVDEKLFDQIRPDMPEKRENTRPKMITEEELQKLFDAYDKHYEKVSQRNDFCFMKAQHWFKPLMMVYFYAGLRRNEAAYDPNLEYSGLKGENLIYENGELSYIYLPPTKGRKERQIPIIQELKENLEEYLQLRGKVKRKEYVFIYLGGAHAGRPVTGERAYKLFKDFLEGADLPSSRTIHGMRHQAVTTWIEKGFHTAEAGYMAGHSSQRVTEKYTHLTAKRLKEKMDRL
jgi:integrase